MNELIVTLCWIALGALIGVLIAMKAFRDAIREVGNKELRKELGK